MALVRGAEYPSQPPDGTLVLNDSEPKDCLSELFDQFMAPDQFPPDQDMMDQYAFGDAGNFFGLDSPFEGHTSAGGLMFSPSTMHSDTNVLSTWYATSRLAENTSISSSSPLRRGHDPTLYQAVPGRAAARLKSEVFGVDSSPLMGMSTLPASPPLTPSTRVTKPHTQSTPTAMADQKTFRWKASERKVKVHGRKKSTGVSKVNGMSGTVVSTPPSQLVKTSGLAPPSNNLPLSPPPSGKAPSDGFPTTFKVPTVGEQKYSYHGSLPFRTINWHVGYPPAGSGTPSVGASNFQPEFGSFNAVIPPPSPLQTDLSNGALGSQVPWDTKDHMVGFGPNQQHSMSVQHPYDQSPTSASSLWWNNHGNGSPSSPAITDMDQRFKLLRASQKVVNMTAASTGLPEQGAGLGMSDIGSTLAMDGLMISCDPMDPFTCLPGGDGSMVHTAVDPVSSLSPNYILSSSMDIQGSSNPGNANGVGGSGDSNEGECSPTASQPPSPGGATTTLGPRKQRQQRQLRRQRRRVTNGSTILSNPNSNSRARSSFASASASHFSPSTQLNASTNNRRGTSRRSCSATGTIGTRGSSNGRFSRGGARHFSSPSSTIRAKPIAGPSSSVTTTKLTNNSDNANNPSTATNPSHAHMNSNANSLSSTISPPRNPQHTKNNEKSNEGLDFVNFTPLDSKKLLTGVAPSGSSKTKARRDKEAADRRRKISVAAVRAVEAAGGSLEVLRSEGGIVL